MWLPWICWVHAVLWSTWTLSARSMHTLYGRLCRVVGVGGGGAGARYAIPFEYALSSGALSEGEYGEESKETDTVMLIDSMSSYSARLTASFALSTARWLASRTLSAPCLAARLTPD